MEGGRTFGGGRLGREHDVFAGTQQQDLRAGYGGGLRIDDFDFDNFDVG